jgi:hypothetical protein
VRTLHQGCLAGGVSPFLIVRSVEYAKWQPHQSRTASEGMSISHYAAVVQGRLEALEAAEE